MNEWMNVGLMYRAQPRITKLTKKILNKNEKSPGVYEWIQKFTAASSGVTSNCAPRKPMFEGPLPYLGPVAARGFLAGALEVGPLKPI